MAELIGSLDLDAGEVATNLLRLYEYVHGQLVAANVGRKPATLDEVEALMSALLSAWEGAFASQHSALRPADERITVNLHG